MPAYFSMTVQFDTKTQSKKLSEIVTNAVIENGYDFQSGYYGSENKTIKEIIDWNQKKLDKKYKLGMHDTIEKDYNQIIFKTELYSEFRGFWFLTKSETEFVLIIPEDDILEKEGGSIFLSNKINPIIILSCAIWENIKVDCIQTGVEFDESCFSLTDVSKGKNLMCHPFAIVRKARTKYNDYILSKEVKEIGNDGLLIIDRNMIK